MAYHPGIRHHPGITMHRLPVSGDILGAVFVVAVVLVILARIPLAPWFLIGTVVFGAVLGIFMIRWHRQHKIEIDDLSTLTDPADKDPKE